MLLFEMSGTPGTGQEAFLHGDPEMPQQLPLLEGLLGGGSGVGTEESPGLSFPIPRLPSLSLSLSKAS